MSSHAKTDSFGVLPSGEEVKSVTISSGLTECEIITFGAAIRSLKVPGRDGVTDVVLGYADLDGYVNGDGSFGAVVGRYANRIAGGRFSLGGQEYSLECNDGPNHLHGGSGGFSRRVWSIEALEESSVTFALFSPDGDSGYPGSVSARIKYTVGDGALTLNYSARCGEKDTVCNLTNHAYFNLAGHDSGDVLDQTMHLFCSSFTPTDSVSIPTGEIRPCEGTPMSFLTPTALGERIDADYDQLRWGRGYDHNYIIDGEAGTLRHAAEAYSGKTGIVMRVETTLPAVQLYTGNYLTERKGKDGAVYGYRGAFCLETQLYPDSPNHPEFPSSVIKAGECAESVTRFVFGVR